MYHGDWPHNIIPTALVQAASLPVALLVVWFVGGWVVRGFRRGLGTCRGDDRNPHRTVTTTGRAAGGCGAMGQSASTLSSSRRTTRRRRTGGASKTSSRERRIEGLMTVNDSGYGVDTR
jgi:hypothetical protein